MLKSIKEFNKNLQKQDKQYIRDTQKSIDRAVKESINNTKLAKNIIFKIK